MQIFLSCLQSLRPHPVAAYQFWEPYFKRGIEEAGHAWFEAEGVDWAEALTLADETSLSRWRDRTWSAVLQAIRVELQHRPVDLFLGYLYPTMVEPGAVREIQRMGIPCVNFFCDNVREFRAVPEQFRCFDLHWVPEFEALPLYRRAGLPYLHAPMPCWVPPELRTVTAIETEPPTFIGSADILRRDLLGRALQAGATFVVQGPGWVTSAETDAAIRTSKRSARSILANQWRLVRAHGVAALVHKLENRLRPLSSPPIHLRGTPSFLSPAEYVRISREALVTIGVNRVLTAHTSNHHPLTYSRLRDIEAPMLGACYLTEWTAGLGELYELGTEIETYNTPEELAAKVEELRRDPARRRRLRERGQRRALDDHSVAHSLKRISEQVPSRRIL